MHISELDYHLPPEAIATQPAEPRDACRLMVAARSGEKAAEHWQFRDIGRFLGAGDVLVVNQSRVLPAKLALRRASGAAIGGLFLREVEAGVWEVMLRTRGKVRDGEVLHGGDYVFELARRLGDGVWRVRVEPADAAAAVLERIGHVPLPPYITRQRKATGASAELPADKAWYQTVYARRDDGGSVAAPTAGLHFTPELLTGLKAAGVEVAPVTLDVGMGTFLPVESPTLETHVMHTERYAVPAATVAALRQARAAGRRIIAVGTTAVRTLESAAALILDATRPADEIAGTTGLLIAPGYRFQLTDGLITNFHLPRSTLMALVAAFLGEGGVGRLKALYEKAIALGYRFYSYGDAMMIAP